MGVQTVNLISTLAMNTKRTNFAAVKLGGGGAILVIGGLDQTGTPLASCELFDPATGTWTTITGTLNAARYNHAAVVTANGAVLIIGGQGAGAAFLSSVEIFSQGSGRPEVTGTFATASNGLSSARANMAATLLPDGRILVGGGADSGDAALSLAEVYSAGI
jgi:Galactose oxidase, central domain